MGEGSAHSKCCTYTGQEKAEKRGRTIMPRAGFEPTIPVFESNLDRAAAGIGILITLYDNSI
jgi:hypothetical protein